jgi:starch synthase
VGLTPSSEAPLFGVVSRLTEQKGLDLLLGALPYLIAEGAQIAILGTGEKSIEQGFAAAQETYAGSVGCVFGYSEPLAHLLQAGSDFLVVPSRFEPCGLTQLCALRYGATPIVARVGGLADTVIDANEAALTAGVATGIQFYPPTAGAIRDGLARALAFHRDAPTMRRLRSNGMRADVSWRGPAKRYAALYRTLAKANP